MAVTAAALRPCPALAFSPSSTEVAGPPGRSPGRSRDPVRDASGSEGRRRPRAGPESAAMPTPPPSPSQSRNPLHGKTLETILTELVGHYGWDGLAQRISLRCFSREPSIGSSLKVLRKTPWAREKVESLYLFRLRELRRTDAQRTAR